MSKRPGAVSSETKNRILEVAKNEFARLGYKGASLRLIASKACVTTGALYFFFDSKDSLFNEVVSSVLDPFMDYIKKHYEDEKKIVGLCNGEDSDYEAVSYIYDIYVKNASVWDIIFHNLDHEIIKGYFNEFINLSLEHYTYLIKSHENKNKKSYNVDEFIVRTFITMQINTIARVIRENKDQALLKEHLKKVIGMLRGAYFALIN